MNDKKEYIEREAAIAFLENIAASRYLIQCFESKEKFPAADVVEVRRGEWIPIKILEGAIEVKCSACKCNAIFGKVKINYCPNCGAKMDGKGEG